MDIGWTLIGGVLLDDLLLPGQVLNIAVFVAAEGMVFCVHLGHLAVESFEGVTPYVYL